MKKNKKIITSRQANMLGAMTGFTLNGVYSYFFLEMEILPLTIPIVLMSGYFICYFTNKCKK